MKFSVSKEFNKEKTRSDFYIRPGFTIILYKYSLFYWFTLVNTIITTSMIPNYQNHTLDTCLNFSFASFTLKNLSNLYFISLFLINKTLIKVVH